MKDLTSFYRKSFLIALTLFVANIVILFVFYAVFRLTDFLSDPFAVSSSETW